MRLNKIKDTWNGPNISWVIKLIPTLNQYSESKSEVCIRNNETTRVFDEKISRLGHGRVDKKTKSTQTAIPKICKILAVKIKTIRWNLFCWWWT